MDKGLGVDDRQPFFSHLAELRRRLLVCIIAAAVAFCGTYQFKEQIFALLMEPFRKVMPVGSAFIFTGVTEGFVTYFKISAVSGIVIVSPVILYQFWRFLSPGLYEKEKRYVYPFMFWGTLCFLLGASFCYLVVMPYLFRFFVSYAGEAIIPMPDLRSYMSLVLKMLSVFGLVFEMPLVIYYLARAGVVSAKMLSSKRRYAVLAIFIVSAMTVAADAVSLLLVAFPLWGLYEISILIARIFGRKEIAE